MKFDLVSDIHVTHWDGGISSIDWNNEKNPESEVLVIAGDVANDYHTACEAVLHASHAYEHVVWVDGNHDHYGGSETVDENLYYIKKFCDKSDKIHFLNGHNTFEINNTIFIGNNGWYDFNVWAHQGLTFERAKRAWMNGSNDAVQINFGEMEPNTRANYYSMLLCEQVRYISKTKPTADIVVVTHTIPHAALMSSRYDRALDGAYCNTLMKGVLKCDEQNQIKVWCYGHTHDRSDKVVDDVRFVNNARGYQMEAGVKGRWWIVQIDTNDSR